MTQDEILSAAKEAGSVTYSPPKEVAFVCFLTIFAPIISLVLILSLIHQVILFLIGGKADENI